MASSTVSTSLITLSSLRAWTISIRALLSTTINTRNARVAQPNLRMRSHGDFERNSLARPEAKKTAAATRRMEIKLAKNNRKDPQAPAYAPIPRQRPVFASGGTMAVAMATPGSAGLMRSSTMA